MKSRLVSIFGYPACVFYDLLVVLFDFFVAILAAEAVCEHGKAELIFCDPRNMRYYGCEADLLDGYWEGRANPATTN
jgi:hypothetical protein